VYIQSRRLRNERGVDGWLTYLLTLRMKRVEQSRADGDCFFLRLLPDHGWRESDGYLYGFNVTFFLP
jgi:hypothetical protein